MLRLIEIFAAPGHEDTIAAIAQRFEVLNYWTEATWSGEMRDYRIVARSEKQQELIDQLQGALGKETPWRIMIMPIEATIPEVETRDSQSRSPEQATREELYADIDRRARIDSTFIQLVVLSSIIAAIGLLESDVAIVIAAMLIAPLLGPNVAMAFGSTLGDRELVTRAAVANATGIALSVACAATVGWVVPEHHDSVELMARTRIGYDSVLLALASGAAGALSLTTQLASTLTGVMVAVALLPPATTLGYMLGASDFHRAGGAAALLAVNVVCVNLSAQLVFLSRGIKPRRWIDRRAAQQSTAVSLAVAFGLLLLLVAIIYLRHETAT